MKKLINELTSGDVMWMYQAECVQYAYIDGCDKQVYPDALLWTMSEGFSWSSWSLSQDKFNKLKCYVIDEGVDVISSSFEDLMSYLIQHKKHITKIGGIYFTPDNKQKIRELLIKVLKGKFTTPNYIQSPSMADLRLH